MHDSHEFQPEYTGDSMDEVWAEIHEDSCRTADAVTYIAGAFRRLPLDGFISAVADGLAAADRAAETEADYLSSLMIDGTPLHAHPDGRATGK